MIRFAADQAVLNGICPYFTMFPLDFPLDVLAPRALRSDSILDPFCGRGTTNFAARLLGLETVGVDSSPVAVAITASKLIDDTPDSIVDAACTALRRTTPVAIPSGKFWELAYHTDVLDQLCRIRLSLLENCSTAPRIALRGIVLGALHGPRQKTFQSYLSNQCPRTYAPKPDYAARFWLERGLRPERVDLLQIIRRRAQRYYSTPLNGTGHARLGDSRSKTSLQPPTPSKKFDWVVTSPPYYGLRTYLPDQWLRYWFLGGPDRVQYSASGQLAHRSPARFADDLRTVWKNAASVCSGTARLVIRFGGIADRRVSPTEIITSSLRGSGWRVLTIKPAGDASHGKRQADTFLRRRSAPIDECVVWASPALLGRADDLDRTHR